MNRDRNAIRRVRPLRAILLVIATVIMLGGVATGVATWVIHQSVRAHCRIAQQAHRLAGDDVAALIAFMDSPAHSLAEKNEVAVWTLGRLRDARALPVLRAAYTGEPCDHDTALCQHELSKAIQRCGGALSSSP